MSNKFLISMDSYETVYRDKNGVDLRVGDIIRIKLENGNTWVPIFLEEHNDKNGIWKIIGFDGTYIKLHSDVREDGYWRHDISLSEIECLINFTLPEELFRI